MPFISSHFTDKDGCPDGGQTHGRGFAIAWQRGPLTKPDGARDEPNGAFVEDVIEAAKGRLEFFQTTKFRSSFNERAIEHLDWALKHLRSRTAERQARNVEGTHEV